MTELTDTRDYWDAQSATFDAQPDHGLLDPAVRAAWAQLLLPLMPPAPASVVDLGCGTGSLAVLLAQAGYQVRGLDLSDRMVGAAVHKAASLEVPATFQQGDATAPPYATSSCDVVLARHVLWALPDPATALGRWVSLLKPGGQLCIIDGRWSTEAGLAATEVQTLLLRHRAEATVRQLTNPTLWGHPIDDERYLVMSRS